MALACKRFHPIIHSTARITQSLRYGSAAIPVLLAHLQAQNCSCGHLSACKHPKIYESPSSEPNTKQNIPAGSTSTVI